MKGEHLEGDVPAERFLHRFVNYAHAAAPHLSKEVVFAQLTRDLTVVDRCLGVRAGRLAVDGSEFFHGDECGEGIADFLGELWVLSSVLGDRRTFSPTIALEEFFG